jgi:hypothetical protein
MIGCGIGSIEGGKSMGRENCCLKSEELDSMGDESEG